MLDTIHFIKDQLQSKKNYYNLESKTKIIEKALPINSKKSIRNVRQNSEDHKKKKINLFKFINFSNFVKISLSLKINFQYRVDFL